MADHSPAFLGLVEETRSRVHEISAVSFVAVWHSTPALILVDVREYEEFIKGHLRGARWLGKGVIERDIEAIYPDLDTALYLYCGGGYRSVLAADNLQRMGYRAVCSIDGGWRALRELLPTVYGERDHP
jgi:rhodanese-related sulfurtransferase